MSAEQAKFVCRVFDLEPETGPGGHKLHAQAVGTFTSMSRANRFKVAVAAATATHDRAYGSSWGDHAQRGIDWATWLENHGWTPTSHDQTVIKTMRAATRP